tara:strand:- start:1088 stop:1414 length:327 start_codon:yes stop_codon:yes gene_type:complete
MTKVTLFYADWCGHCNTFKPEWEKLKEILPKNNIEFAEYEDSKNADVINSNNIEGFPTIKIETNEGTFDYNGRRDADSILDTVLPLKQTGGLSSNRYVNKKIYMIKYR